MSLLVVGLLPHLILVRQLLLALFRILEAASGKILIDGVDISTIGLHDRGSNLAVCGSEHNTDPWLSEQCDR